MVLSSDFCVGLFYRSIWSRPHRFTGVQEKKLKYYYRFIEKSFWCSTYLIALFDFCPKLILYWCCFMDTFMSITASHCSLVRWSCGIRIRSSEPKFVNVGSPEIDSKESISPAYVAWRAGVSNTVGLTYRPARMVIDSWAT